MRVPASYYATPDATPVLIYVRVHTKWVQQGDLKGTNLTYAEQEERAPKLIFMRSEVALPPRNALVVVAADEGYRVGQTEQPDGLTITADATPLTAAEMVGLTLPEDLP